MCDGKDRKRQTKVGKGEDSPYSGLYEKSPPERGRVGISQV